MGFKVGMRKKIRDVNKIIYNFIKFIYIFEMR